MGGGDKEREYGKRGGEGLRISLSMFFFNVKFGNKDHTATPLTNTERDYEVGQQACIEY